MVVFLFYTKRVFRIVFFEQLHRAPQTGCTRTSSTTYRFCLFDHPFMALFVEIVAGHDHPFRHLLGGKTLHRPLQQHYEHGEIVHGQINRGGGRHVQENHWCSEQHVHFCGGRDGERNGQNHSKSERDEETEKAVGNGS